MLGELGPRSPLGPPGPVVAPPSVAPEAWASALEPRRCPLVLAPSSARGWFEGTAVVAWDPVASRSGLTMRAAAEDVQAAFDARAPLLGVALLPYEGACADVSHRSDACATATYEGGVVRCEDGWRVWGSPASPPPDPSPLATPPAHRPSAPLARDVVADLDEAAFRSAVEEVREAVANGAVYVLNLTYRLTGTPLAPAEDAFRTLLAPGGADMAAFWRTGDGAALASISPERFLAIREGSAEIHPIKGTRPRGLAPDADRALAEELLSSEKELAEHVMIVDLERNDLGRIAVTGSVVVDPLYEVVSLPYCHQLVSAVHALPRDDVSLGDILVATFPCGSVTGAPKLAAMRAIERLERSPRGAYTGALAVAVPGRLDSSVLIRTAEYAGGRVRWGTGGGITIDSDPAEEWRETLLKATPFTGG